MSLRGKFFAATYDRQIAKTEVIVGSHSKSSELGETPRDVFDIFVESEDLHRLAEDLPVLARADDADVEPALLADLAEGRLLGRLGRVGRALGEGPRLTVALSLALADDQLGRPVDEPDDDATGRGGDGLLQAGHAGATEERRGPPPRVELVHSIEDAGFGRPLRTGRAGSATHSRT